MAFHLFSVSEAWALLYKPKEGWAAALSERKLLWLLIYASEDVETISLFILACEPEDFAVVSSVEVNLLVTLELMLERNGLADRDSFELF